MKLGNLSLWEQKSNESWVCLCPFSALDSFGKYLLTVHYSVSGKAEIKVNMEGGKVKFDAGYDFRSCVFLSIGWPPQHPLLGHLM